MKYWSLIDYSLKFDNKKRITIGDILWCYLVYTTALYSSVPYSCGLHLSWRSLTNLSTDMTRASTSTTRLRLRSSLHWGGQKEVEAGLVLHLSCRVVKAVACLARPGKLEAWRKNLTSWQVSEHLDQWNSWSKELVKVFADIEEEMLERYNPWV